MVHCVSIQYRIDDNCFSAFCCFSPWFTVSALVSLCLSMCHWFSTCFIVFSPCFVVSVFVSLCFSSCSFSVLDTVSFMSLFRCVSARFIVLVLVSSSFSVFSKYFVVLRVVFVSFFFSSFRYVSVHVYVLVSLLK